jgi:glycosyltransferase involved in cell wall biosynthesis
MRVALLTSTAWLDEEAAGFRELVDRLGREQIEAVQVVPHRFPQEDLSPAGQRVVWDEPEWAWLRALRLARLAETLEPLEVDLVHAMSGSVWHGAARLAGRLGVPLVLNTTSFADVEMAERLPAKHVARPAFIASTEPLVTALRNKVGSAATIELIRAGVEPAPEPPAPRSHASFCAAVSGAESLDEDFEALLEAIKRVVATARHCQFFLAGQGDTHQLWQAVRRAGLLPNLSLVPRRLGHGQLLLRADALLHPQALERSRWLTLQAMARGQPLIARSDPALDYLLDNETAWVVPAPAADAWERLLRRVIDEPAQAAQLGDRARRWVTPRHTYARQVAQISGVYRQLSGAAMPFRAATG